MRRLVLVLIVVALAGVLLTRAEPFGPRVTLETPGDTIGRAATLRVVASDRGSGLAWLEVRLQPAGGGTIALASETWPRRSLLGSGVHEAVLTASLEAAPPRLAEGPATIEVWAADHSWLSAFRRSPRLVRTVTLDLTPPTVELLSAQHVARLGGSECAVYRVGADAVESGVQVGPHRFAGVAMFADRSLRAALFALPQDLPGAQPALVALDAAGNARTLPMGVVVHPRRFAEKTLPITDDFLVRKVPELLQANGLEPGGELVAGYLRINRDLRATTEERLRGMCRETAPAPLWDGAFLRLPNSAPLSGFADRRTYLYQGKEIDRQTHLGFDLASLRGSPVPAANGGRVVFTGPLGIYGTTVVIDHGLGLFSLYGHLSEVSVAAGATVVRGDPIGKTGDTGLAAGDHLHFSTMIHGVHVDPVEWWDGHWIQDHVLSRLAVYPRGGAGS